MKKLFRFVSFLFVLAAAGCGYFYYTRKEHFTCPADFFEELKGTLSTLPGVALFIF